MEYHELFLLKNAIIFLKNAETLSDIINLVTSGSTSQTSGGDDGHFGAWQAHVRALCEIRVIFSLLLSTRIYAFVTRCLHTEAT